MDDEVSAAPPDLLRRLTIPTAAAVAIVVAIAWYVTWASTDAMMTALAPGMLGSTDLAVFVALNVVMMVAMMLPSALPMVLAYRGLTRLEGGVAVRPADNVGTFVFLIPYFVVWGAFGVAALLGLTALGTLGPWTGLALFVPAATLGAAGVWQVTRTKGVCLAHCTSPMGFVVHHWRPGRLGAFRMGARHSLYCVGCCWLFMVVLFVAGATSLAWMGAVSVGIFVEKLGLRPLLVSRTIGVLLVALGSIAAFAAFFSL